MFFVLFLTLTLKSVTIYSIRNNVYYYVTVNPHPTLSLFKVFHTFHWWGTNFRLRSHTHTRIHPPGSWINQSQTIMFMCLWLWGLYCMTFALTIPRKHKMCNYDRGMLLIELAYSQNLTKEKHTHTYTRTLINSFWAAMWLILQLSVIWRHPRQFMWSKQERIHF